MPRLFMALRPVNGKGTRTTSPWLKLVVDGILGVVPELERRFGRFEPGDIVRLNFQMRGQIVKEPYLVAHIQVLDCLADFLNRAHEKNLTQIFRRRSAENSRRRRKDEVRIKDVKLRHVPRRDQSCNR